MGRDMKHENKESNGRDGFNLIFIRVQELPQPNQNQKTKTCMECSLPPILFNMDILQYIK